MGNWHLTNCYAQRDVVISHCRRFSPKRPLCTWGGPGGGSQAGEFRKGGCHACYSGLYLHCKEAPGAGAASPILSLLASLGGRYINSFFLSSSFPCLPSYLPYLSSFIVRNLHIDSANIWCKRFKHIILGLFVELFRLQAFF